MLKELTAISLLGLSLVSCETSHKETVKTATPATTQQNTITLTESVANEIKEVVKTIEATGFIADMQDNKAKLIHYGITQQEMEYAQIIYLVIEGFELLMQVTDAYKNQNTVKIMYHEDPKCLNDYYMLDQIEVLA
jgi:hypothetical protein